MSPSFIGFDAVCAGGVQKHHSHISMERKARPLAASPCNSTYSSPGLSSTDFSDGTLSSQEDTDQEFISSGKSLTGTALPTKALSGKLQDVIPVPANECFNPIWPANRRSSTFSECMMREVLAYKPLGRDRDGIMNYALFLEESQGFRWNKNMQKFHSKLFATRMISPLNVAGLYDIYSDDDDFIEDDDTPSNERVISIE